MRWKLLGFVFLLVCTFQAVPSGAEAPAVKPIRVTMVVPDRENSPFWSEVTVFMQAVADQLKIDLKFRHMKDMSRFSYSDAIMQEAYGNPMPDYLMHIFLRSHAELYLKKTGAAGVKSFTFNTEVPDEERDVGQPREKFPNWIGHSYPDDMQAGYDLARYLVETAHGKWGQSHKIRVLAFLGGYDSLAAKHRQMGMEMALGRKNAVLLQGFETQWLPERVYRKLPALIRRHPHPDVIWSASDAMAIAARQSLLDHKIRLEHRPVIGGIDWTYKGLQAIHDGRMDASLGGHFMEGGWGLIKIFDYHHGIDFALDCGVSSKLRMPLITRENMNDYLALLGDRDWRKVDFRGFSKFLNPDLQKYDFSVEGFVKKLAESRIAGQG